MPSATNRRWWVLGLIAVAQLMLVLDATVVNIALPSAQVHLGFSDGDRQWIVTAYALSFGSLPLLGGRIRDPLGRRQTLIVRPGATRHPGRAHRVGGGVRTRLRVLAGRATRLGLDLNARVPRWRPGPARRVRRDPAARRQPTAAAERRARPEPRRLVPRRRRG